MRAAMVVQAYRFALAPTPGQGRMLVSHAGAGRFAWNWGLARCTERYKAEGRWYSTAELHKLWNAAKKAGPALAWWGENSKCVYQEAFRDLERALRHFTASKKGQRKGRRLGFPTVAGPKPLRSSLRRLRRADRAHSRTAKGSANRRKPAARLARIHARVANVVWEALIRLNLLLPDPQLSRLRKLEVRPIGLALPPSLPPMDGRADRFRRQLSYVLLSYGKNPLDPAEPVIEIQTCPAGNDSYEPPSVTSILTHADRADRPLTIAPSTAWEGGLGSAPRDQFVSTRRTILVGTTERQVAVVSRGRCEALRFRHGDLVATVLARPGLPPRLALQHIDDLEPFITAAKQLRHDLREAVRSGTLGPARRPAS